MSVLAAVLTPVDRSAAIELGNGTWRKRVLPIGDIDYQGRTLHFTKSYLAGLVRAFRDGAYDAVPFQLADAANVHTNDPERTRGMIADMSLEPDGLWITAEVTPRGEQVLRENPRLGVSARIVEQYNRADGRHYPAAVQHILGTLDPRIPALGPWQQVEMSSPSGATMTIDLSAAVFSGAGEPDGSLTDAELADLLDAISEADAEGWNDGGDELTDAELEALMAEASAEEADDGYTEAAEQFSAAFSSSYAAAQAREDARAAAIVEDTLHPARRDEDRMARIMRRAQAGVYDGQQLSFASEQAAVELAMSTGLSPCGPPDSYGRCSARYHALGCSHPGGADPQPGASYEAALANIGYEGSLELAGGTPVPVWDDDSDDPYALVHPLPQQTVELAAGIADWSGLHGDTPAWFQPGYADPLGYASMPQSTYDALAEPIGYAAPPERTVAYPGISELARGLGLK